MTLDQFTTKWLNKRTDEDGVYGYQCVDLIKTYAKEVHGITPGAWGDAVDYWTNTKHPLLSKGFSRVTGTPQKGDIVILGATLTNKYGHIGIAVNNTTMIEQNGATGDGDGLGGDEVRYRTIPTSRVVGLLRKEGVDDMIKKEDIDAIRIVMSEVEGWNAHEVHAGKHDSAILGWVGQSWPTFLRNGWNVQKVKRFNLDEKIASLTTEKDHYQKSYNTAQATVSELGNALSIKDKEIASLKAQVGDNSKWETLKALIRELVGK